MGLSVTEKVSAGFAGRGNFISAGTFQNVLGFLGRF